MKPAACIIRLAAITDAAPIAALLHELGYPVEVEAVRNNIALLSSSPGNIVLVADAAPAIAGAISFHIIPLFHTVGSLGRITSLVVGAQWQRQGIGGKLVQTVEEYGRAHGCARIEVTSGDHRAGAHAFYQGLGYQVDERRFIKRFETD